MSKRTVSFVHGDLVVQRDNNSIWWLEAVTYHSSSFRGTCVHPGWDQRVGSFSPFPSTTRTKHTDNVSIGPSAVDFDHARAIVSLDPTLGGIRNA